MHRSDPGDVESGCGSALDNHAGHGTSMVQGRSGREGMREMQQYTHAMKGFQRNERVRRVILPLVISDGGKRKMKVFVNGSDGRASICGEDQAIEAKDWTAYFTNDHFSPFHLGSRRGRELFLGEEG